MTSIRRPWSCALLLLICAGLSGCTHLFFYPQRDEVQDPSRLNLSWEDVFLPEGQHGWYLRAPAPGRGTILYFHGNGENISTFIGAVWWLPARGYNVFMLDYSGYGKSAGEASVDAVHHDAEQALRYLAGRGGIDRDRLMVFGQSLGGSVAIYLAAKSDLRGLIRGVIAESAFSGYRHIAREKIQGLWFLAWLRYPLSWLFDNRYSADRAMPDLPDVPLLLIHGDQDEVVPVHHSQRLYAAARNTRKQFWNIKDGKHIDALKRPEYREQLVAWLDAVPPTPAIR